MFQSVAEKFIVSHSLWNESTEIGEKVSLQSIPTIEQIKRVPKVLLHDHLDGGLRPQTIIDIAKKIGYTALPTDNAAELAMWFREACDSGSLVRYLETFSHTIAVMQSRENILQVARECALDLARDGDHRLPIERKAEA